MTIFLKFICYYSHGDIVKKYLKILVFAICLGGIIAYFFYKDINKEVKAITKKEEIVNLFQVGVFKSYNNALEFSKVFNSSYIYENDGYYRVIIAASYSKEALVKLESLYKNKDINYYLKEIRVNKKFIEKLKNYEKVIIKSNKEEIIDNVNNSVLNLFDSYIKKS